MRKCIIILIVFFMIFCIFSTTKILAAGSINFDYKRKAININEMFDIDSILTGNTGEKILWSSSDKTVAAVSNTGIVAGKKLGQAIIRATAPNGEYSECIVSVGYYTGIDVSHHNGTVNWQKVKQQGIDFAMIRTGWFSTSAQQYNIDEQLLNNLNGAVQADIPFGIYHYSYAWNIAEVNEECDKLINLINTYTSSYVSKISLPIAYDLEEASILAHANKTQLTEMAITFCRRIYNAGFIPMIYANENWFTNHIDVNMLVQAGYDIWLAKWPNNVNFSNKISINNHVPMIWQYTSSGSIEGATTSDGRTDMNVMYMEPNTKTGDLDGNGRLGSNDAYEILKLIVSGNTATAEQIEVADLDKNEKIGPYDAYLVLKYIVSGVS